MSADRGGRQTKSPGGSRACSSFWGFLPRRTITARQSVFTLGWAPKGPTQARRREADIHRLLLKVYDDDSVYDLE